MMNMNMTAVALGAAALAALAPAAHAQVTLGGIADAAVRRVHNEGLGSATGLVSGSNSTSRLIVRGNEDLGDGWSAGFHLEHGIALDTGTQVSSTQFWDRRSTLSLASKTFGEIRAGRDFVPSYSNWSRYDPFSYVGVAGSNNLVSASPSGPIRNAFGSSPNTVVRSSNAVQLLLPSGLGGVEGGLMVAAGEGGLAANGQHKVIGARLGFAQQAFGISAAYTRTRNDLTGSEAFTDAAIGGNADFGVVRISAAWRRFAQGDARQTNLLLGAWIPVGGSGEVKLSWTRADLSGRVADADIGDNDAMQFGLGYVHNLSKRSALYASVSRLANDGTATFAVPGGPSGLAGGGNSTGIEFGMRHTF